MKNTARPTRKLILESYSPDQIVGASGRRMRTYSLQEKERNLHVLDWAKPSLKVPASHPTHCGSLILPNTALFRADLEKEFGKWADFSGNTGLSR